MDCHKESLVANTYYEFVQNNYDNDIEFNDFLKEMKLNPQQVQSIVMLETKHQRHIVGNTIGIKCKNVVSGVPR